VIYKEALQRNQIHSFLEVLGSSVEATTDKNGKLSSVYNGRSAERENVQPRQGYGTGKYQARKHDEGSGERVRQVDSVRRQAELFEHNIQSASTEHADAISKPAGCGLSFIANKVKEHYDDKDHRANKLRVRLIGEQAIALAKHRHTLIDALELPDESATQKLRRQAIGKASQHLRNAGTLFNKVDTTLVEIEQLKENLTTYFNLLSLFFNSSVNVKSARTPPYAVYVYITL
jgi:hypothetical protein